MNQLKANRIRINVLDEMKKVRRLISKEPNYKTLVSLVKRHDTLQLRSEKLKRWTTLQTG